MRQLQRVLWTKGLLLNPQHLQAQDRFAEDLLEFRLSALTFCPWGFRRLELDHEALTRGKLAISSAQGILPDGLPFDIPDSDPPPAPLSVEDHWSKDSDQMEVALALPERKPGGLNVGADERSDTRYRAAVVLLRDENTGGAEKPVQVTRKNFLLMTGRDRSEGSARLPVARIVRTSSGDFALDERFVPPVLDIAASPYLLSLARRLVEILVARSSALGDMRRQRTKDLADFGVADVANFWLLYTVNAHLPRFRHILDTRRGHPADLFEAMLEFAGALSTFSRTTHARDFPTYEHGALEGCFTKLDAIVRELLQTVVPTRHASLPLTPTAPSVYATAIDQDRYLDAPQLYLAIRSAIDRSELVTRVPQLVKVGSSARMEVLVGKALPGVRVRHVPVPPSALPVKLDFEYFELERAGEEWTSVRAARNLAAYVPREIPEPRLELVVLLPQT